MGTVTTAELLQTKEFWILGVTSGILANLILMLLWRGRRLVMLGVGLGLAHRKGYLKAREGFAEKMAERRNVDILSFLVLNHLANFALSLLFLIPSGMLFFGALGSSGHTRLILTPLAIIVLLWALTSTISTLEKYYIAEHAMSLILKEVIYSSPGGEPVLRKEVEPSSKKKGSPEKAKSPSEQNPPQNEKSKS